MIGGAGAGGQGREAMFRHISSIPASCQGGRDRTWQGEVPAMQTQAQHAYVRAEQVRYDTRPPVLCCAVPRPPHYTVHTHCRTRHCSQPAPSRQAGRDHKTTRGEWWSRWWPQRERRGVATVGPGTSRGGCARRRRAQG